MGNGVGMEVNAYVGLQMQDPGSLRGIERGPWLVLGIMHQSISD